MKPVTYITRTLAFAAGVPATLLLLEVAIRVSPVIAGTYAADPREQWPVHTMIPNTEYTYSTGWNLQNVHRGRINNYGYASPQDYQPGRGDIAVFGDSYIEAMMNDHADTLPGALNDYLRSPREVLSFGMSGAEMPDYLGVSSLVRREFSPEWAVFVITAGDFTNGFNAAPGFFEWDARQSPPIRLVPEIHRSELSKFSRTVGLVRYLRGNLLLRPGEMIKLRRGADHAAGARHPGVRCRPQAHLRRVRGQRHTALPGPGASGQRTPGGAGPAIRHAGDRQRARVPPSLRGRARPAGPVAAGRPLESRRASAHRPGGRPGHGTPGSLKPEKGSFSPDCIFWFVPLNCAPFRSRGLSPQRRKSKIGAVVQLVRIPACHAGGRGFESRPLRQSF